MVRKGRLGAARTGASKSSAKLCGIGFASALFGLTVAEAARADAGTTGSLADTSQLQEVTVTAQRLELLGTASTASEGIVDDQELQLTPQYRPGQLLETVPGLIVTLHSGEGKANQYLMRGYNLDHGTDLETYVDGMPINQPTHAHGQGYTDLNFVIPARGRAHLHQGFVLRNDRGFRRGGFGADEPSRHHRGSGFRVGGYARLSAPARCRLNRSRWGKPSRSRG